MLLSKGKGRRMKGAKTVKMSPSRDSDLKHGGATEAVVDGRGGGFLFHPFEREREREGEGEREEREEVIFLEQTMASSSSSSPAKICQSASP